jgi:hypothetical protein
VPRASLPSPGFTPPTRISSDGLSVRFTDETSGRSGEIDLRAFPGPVLVRQEIVVALSLLTDGVHGWRSKRTVAGGRAALSQFLRWLAQVGIQSLAEFTSDHWTAYDVWARENFSANTHWNDTGRVRTVLRNAPAVPAATRPALSARRGAGPQHNDQESYSSEDFLTLSSNAAFVIRRAHARITRNYSFVQRLAVDDPTLSPDERRYATALTTLMDTTGQVPGDVVGLLRRGGVAPRQGGRGRRYPDLTDLLPGLNFPTWRNLLFLAPEEALAAVVVLIVDRGYNESVATSLTVGADDLAVSDDGLRIRVAYTDKPRRGQAARAEHEVYVSDGSPGSETRQFKRLLRVVEATDPARDYAARHGSPTDTLVLYFGRGPVREDRDAHSRAVAPSLYTGLPFYTSRSGAQWVQATGVSLDLSRLRHTFVVLNRRPTHHSLQTHVTNYLSLDPAERVRADDVARQAFERRNSEFEQDFRSRIADDADAAEANDTVTASCEDIDHNPDTGEPCRENFLTCLTCSNAIVTPRHLPRLAKIHEALTDLRTTLTPASWERWAEHFLRLDYFLKVKAGLSEDALRDCARRATQRDDRLVRELLRGDLDVA